MTKKKGKNKAPKKTTNEPAQEAVTTVTPSPVPPEPSGDIFPGAEMFHDGDEPWAHVAIAGHWENHLITSSTFKTLVTRRLRELMGEMPGTKEVNETIRHYEGEARFDGPNHRVELRLAQHGGDIYIDLGTADWSAVKISRSGWKVIPDPPVRFKRTPLTRPLPIPKDGGDVFRLFRYVNIKDRPAQILVLAWLVGALNPHGAYPLLVMSGQQGSAKTTTQTILRRLIDPSSIPLTTTPRNERDLVLTAKQSHILAFDNLSDITPAFSDALCRMATGSAFATRQLYSDADLVTFSGRRPMMFNGIGNVASRSDLLDRIIMLSLPKIEESSRKTERDILHEFESDIAKIFGAILTAVSAALSVEKKFIFEALPRMADFARWASAALLVFGITPKEFQDAYDANRQELRRTAIEDSPLVDVLIESQLIKRLYSGTDWVGTHGELLKELQRSYNLPSGFPKTARALSAELARIEPNLVEVGIRINPLKREPGTGRRLIHIEATREGVKRWHQKHEAGATARAATKMAEQERITGYLPAATEWLKSYLADGEPKERNEIHLAAHKANRMYNNVMNQALKDIGGEESNGTDGKPF